MNDYEEVEIKDPVTIDEHDLRQLLDENKRLREEVSIKERLLGDVAEDYQECESEYKRLYKENEQLREENRRIKQKIKENTGVDIDAWKSVNDG